MYLCRKLNHMNKLNKLKKISIRWVLVCIFSFFAFYISLQFKIFPTYIAFGFLCLSVISFFMWKLYEVKYDKIHFDETFKKMNEEFYRFYEQLNNDLMNKSTRLSDSYKLFKLNDDVPFNVVKNRYKELAFIWHPDKWTTSSVENQKIAERNFKKLQNAYDLIKKSRGIK